LTADELVYHLRLVKASLMVVHPRFLDTALSAAHVVGLQSDHIVLLDSVLNDNVPNFCTVRELITGGLYWEHAFIERILEPGEGRTKLALLCLSSGTTGKPKVHP
jgi:4-coumarate--CoA ligase